MKLLRKVKKYWVAVSIGAIAVILPSNVSTVSAEVTQNPENIPTDTVASAVYASETERAAENSETITVPEVSDLVSTDQKTAEAVSDSTADTVSVLPASFNTGSSEVLNTHNTADEAALQEKAAPVISGENTSVKLLNAVTADNRTVVSQPASENAYTVKYDENNQWYYIDAIDFGLNVQDSGDDTAAINKALAAANDIIMEDADGNHYTGVAVKLTGVVNVAREQGVIDHYELRTYGDGISYLVNGVAISGINDTKSITESEYKQLAVDSDGLISYVAADGTVQMGVILPIYKQDGGFNQIKIDSDFSNVTALFGDGAGSTDIRTNLVQLGEPWNSDDNDTDSRDHAVVLVEGLDGFIIKDLSVTIKGLDEAFGNGNDGFYVKGMPYYGKVNAIQIDDSSNVTVDNVEAFGANKAGIYFTSSYNSVSNIQLDADTWNGKNFGTTKLRSVNYLVSHNAEGYSFDSLHLGVNNKVINSNLHTNRVAGVQFAYQTSFLVEGTTLSENGHYLSGSTGYGVASSAGSYNSQIVFRDNVSTYNYRKGFDIHDGDYILIENNISYGDRLLGISVYNRTYPMENVIIRNNVVTQDKDNRLAQNDLTADGSFSSNSDYKQYEAIHLQTNEKAGDLSKDGSVGYFEISNNIIQGLDASGTLSNGENYVTNAVMVRMQEPYLDYLLNINNNTIQGDSASTILKIISSANDNLNNSGSQTDTTAFANGLGYGSGAVNISGNKVNVGTVTGEPDKSLSPIHISEDIMNTLIRDIDDKDYAYQDKFRGSLVIENNEFNFGNTNVSGNTYTVAPVSIATNAEGIVIKDNTFDFGSVNQSYTSNAGMQKPLIQVSGLNGPTVQPAVNHLAINTSIQASNLPSTLRYTQPFVFLNNDISITDISYHARGQNLPMRVLTSTSVIRYIDNNTFTSRTEINVNPVEEASDANGNTVYETAKIEKANPAGELNSRVYNLAVERFSTEDPSLISSISETLERETIYINDSNLAAGEMIVDAEGQDGIKQVDTYAVGINNTVYDARGDINVYDPYPSLKTRFFTLENLEDANDNNRVLGLQRGDYITTNGENLVASKTYHYLSSANETLTADISYSYANMPVMLADDTVYTYTEETVLAPAFARVVRIGTNTSTAVGIVETEIIPFETVYIESDSLFDGETVMDTAGVDGERVLIYREIRDTDDASVLGDRVLVSTTVTQQPVNEIILIGAKALMSAVERIETRSLPYTSIVQETAELFLGESRLQTAGAYGVEVTVYRDVVDNRTGEIISTEVINSSVTVEPVDEIIMVGTRSRQTAPVVRTVTETIPYGRYFIEDSSLPAGQELVQVVGQNGVRTLVYHEMYDEQGNLLSSVLVSSKITAEVIDEVVLIGSKAEQQAVPAEQIAETAQREEKVSYQISSIQTEGETAAFDRTLPATGDSSNPAALLGFLIAGLGFSYIPRKRKK
ncbi:G5 domain-containing protein [Streptococcus sp. H31]|uniref:G5 domain-containing protein n=1 Tax=Streptococcus huangxiaojuni TaxID=3237239 RepID=UPI0034A1061E